MYKTMYVLLTVILLMFPTSANSLNCRDYQYYDLEILECMECRHCKKFEINLAECSDYNNTVCIGLKNISLLSKKEIRTYLSQIEFGFDRLEKNENKHDKTPAENDDKSEQVPDTKVNISSWKMLSYSLTGVLGFLVVVSTFILLFLWRRKKLSLKEYTNLQSRQALDGEMGNEYVIFHGRVLQNASYDEEDINSLLPRLPIRGCRVIDQNVRKYSRYHRKRLYKPQRRLLTEGVDDVFESEDSGGSRTLRLHTIPERSDSDIDDILNTDKKSGSSSDKQEKGSKTSRKSSTDGVQSSDDLCEGALGGDIVYNRGTSTSSNRSIQSDVQECEPDGSGLDNHQNKEFGSYVNLKETPDMSKYV